MSWLRPLLFRLHVPLAIIKKNELSRFLNHPLVTLHVCCSMLLSILIVVVPCTLGLQVANISLCPQLAMRTNPPLGAYDLRPDDFTMIMALGDRLD
jgi:hypothetical protein